jgi:hypothetical protein
VADMQQYFLEMYGEPDSDPAAPVDSASYNIAREFFPGASDDELGFILWNCTSYPILPKGNHEVYLREELKKVVAGECEELPIIKRSTGE